jgi:tRNA(Arg) A34 adenosine deaminase TadA
VVPASETRETCEAEQLAFELGGDVAFLHAAQGVYFARGEEWPPVSPVLRLLRGLYELEPRRARFIARSRIFSTRPASSTCLGATRVAARHLRAAVRARDRAILGLAELPRIEAGRAAPSPRCASAGLEASLAALVGAGPKARDDRDWMALVGALTAELRRRAEALEPGERWDKPVTALLADAHGTLLAWATNTGALNATSHAEINLVEGWLQRESRRLPRGCRIYTTRKPCKMCAGFIWDSAVDPYQLQVFHAEDDPLRYARETVLDARSMARRRVAPSAYGLEVVLQRPLT